MTEYAEHNSIRIINKKISLADVQKIAEEQFGDMVKAVVDIDKGIMAIGGELHADEEALLLENSSRQENVWGINIYPRNAGEDFIEFDSMINIRPRHNNHSRSVENEEIRKKIAAVVNELVE